MRIICKIVGDSRCFHLECETKKGFGFDIPATTLFASSLCNSLTRQMDRLADAFKGLVEEDKSYKTNAERIARKLGTNRFGFVYVDIAVVRRKGKQIAVCKISIDDSDCDVRTANILPETARFIYKTIYLLKHMESPKGMEILKTMEITRDFHDPKSKTHELYIEDGTVKEREKGATLRNQN